MKMLLAMAAANPPADERLSSFAAGDLDAFESLFRDSQNAVFGWIVRIVRDRGAAEDLTIETFWRIYRSRSRFDPTRSFLPWARRIATNVAIAHLKHAPRNAPARVPALHRELAIEIDQREKIVAAFEALPAKLRATAMLALIEEQPYDEIGDALGISVPAVKSRVFRATRMLRKKLERMGIDR